MATATGQELEFEKCESSNVHSHAFNAGRNVIVVRFHNGNQYEYPKCDANLYDDMKKAKSVGKFIYAQLNKKPYKRIDDWK